MKYEPKSALPVLAKLAADHAARLASDEIAVERKAIARDEFRRWYLINVEVRRENTVSGHLIGKGVPMFFPELRGDKDGTRRPMFPGYGFVRADMDVEGSKIRSRPGVIGFVKGTDGYPAIVSFDLIEEVREAERLALGGKPTRIYQRGDRVEVGEGAFYGLKGLVHRLASRDRIVLLFDVLGRSTPVTVLQREVFAI